MKTKLLIPFAIAFAFGCGSPNTSSGDPKNSSEPTATPTEQNIAANVDQKATDGHKHEPPHGGTLIEFGEEFAHLEIVLDSATGKLTGYTLDGEAEKSVRIAQETIIIEIEKPSKFILTLQAVDNSLTGEKRGATSEFVGQSDQLKNLAEFSGHISTINIRGRQFKTVDFDFPKGNEHAH